MRPVAAGMTKSARERGSVDKTLGAEHGPATAGNDEVVTIGNSFGYAEAGFAEAGPFGCERIEKAPPHRKAVLMLQPLLRRTRGPTHEGARGG